MSDEIKASAITLPVGSLSGTLIVNNSVATPVKRYWSKSNNLRWSKGVLQQEWVEQDECWIDWAGPHPVYEWRDVPTETAEAAEESEDE